MLPAVYRLATAAATPLVHAYLRHRLRRGKEDRARFRERLGHAVICRPDGKLVWVHAASVGETMSVLALVEAMLTRHRGLSVLITTGTVTAARLLEPRLPARAVHQFVPVDLPAAVERFLDHWNPDLALWVESELWPNLVLATRRRFIPMALVNARLSARSQARWQTWPGLSRPIVSSFAVCLAQDEVQAARFRRLGAPLVAAVGDLKAAAETLPADRAAVTELRHQIQGRPVWIAASTHPGEDETVAAAHARIARRHARLLTIIAPRHPARGPAIAAMLAQQGLRVARRGAGQAVAPATDIYIADTLGELGLFYRLVDIAFIGGSLVDKGGHNPFEAARLGCAILHGPDMRNCAAMAASLAASSAVIAVSDGATLADVVSGLLSDGEECGRRAAAAATVAEAGRSVLAAVLERLAPWLDALAPAQLGARERNEMRQAAASRVATADAGP